MSWDIYIQDLPDVAKALDIPKDFKPASIGERSTIEAAIRHVWPKAEIEDGGWVFVKGEGHDLSVHLVPDEQGNVHYVVVHVHDGHDSPRQVAKLVKRIGRKALDTETSEFFDLADPEAGFKKWRERKKDE